MVVIIRLVGKAQTVFAIWEAYVRYNGNKTLKEVENEARTQLQFQ